MTQEEKQLLLKDLCARLPYGTQVVYNGITETLSTLHIFDMTHIKEVYVDIKPYLRPMSSVSKMWGGLTKEEIENPWILFDSPVDALNYFLTNHIDFRGLIPMGLALEAPEDMYKTE